MLVTTIDLNLSPDQQNLHYLMEITDHALDNDSIMTLLKDITSYKQKWYERSNNYRKLFMAFHVLTVIIFAILLMVFPRLQSDLSIVGILAFTAINSGAFFTMVEFMRKEAKRDLDRRITEENEQIRHTGFFWVTPFCFFGRLELHQDSAYIPPLS